MYVLLACLAILLISTSQAISVSMSSSNGGQSSLMSTSYNLDKHSLATFSGYAKDGMTGGTLTASGSGKNEISVTSNNYMVAASSPEGDFSVKLDAGNGAVVGNVKVAGLTDSTSPSSDIIKVTEAIMPSGKSAMIYSGTTLVSIVNAYSIMGAKWLPLTGASPKIQMQLKAYAIPMPGIPPLYVDGAGNVADADRYAMNRAQGTWDYFTVRQLFAGSPTITTTGTSGVYDGRNIIDFKYLSSTSAIAYTSTYMTSATYNGWHQIVEADTTLNSKYSFSVDTKGVPGYYDMETVMMNEYGHVLGLNDIYGPTQTAYPSQVMNGNLGTGVVKQQYLGKGDYNGLDAIYGGIYGHLTS